MNGPSKRNAIDERLRSLERDARLRVDDVLHDAANPLSPLHECFEWDDTVAAYRYRQYQARKLITSVYVAPRQGVPASRPIVVYARDPDAEAREQGYRRVAEVKNDRDTARDMLLDEADRAAAYLARVEMLARGLELEDELQATLSEYAEFRRIAESGNG